MGSNWLYYFTNFRGVWVMEMPKANQMIIDAKPSIVAGLAQLLPKDAVLHYLNDTRPYECVAVWLA